MTVGSHPMRRPIAGLAVAFIAAAIFTGCERAPSDQFQGYVEGEYIYIASPYAGALRSLSVRRGTQVDTGDPLFALEQVSEKAMRDEAERKLSQARANLDDARKGKRPSEIESLKAQLKQAQTAWQLSLREVGRQEGLAAVSGAAVELEVDRARSARDQNRQRVAQLEADLDHGIARFPHRSDRRRGSRSSRPGSGAGKSRMGPGAETSGRAEGRPRVRYALPRG